jgi:hypothetical protein
VPYKSDSIYSFLHYSQVCVEIMQVTFLLGTLLVVATILVATSARKPDKEVDKYFLEYIALLDKYNEMKLWKSEGEHFCVNCGAMENSSP